MFTAGRGAERGWETDSARASHHAKAPEVPGAPSAGSLAPRMGLPSCGFDSFPGDLPPAQRLHIPQSPQSKDEMASSQRLKEHLKVQSFHQEFCTKSFACHAPSTELLPCAISPSSQRASRWVCTRPGSLTTGRACPVSRGGGGALHPHGPDDCGQEEA